MGEIVRVESLNQEKETVNEPAIVQIQEIGWLDLEKTDGDHVPSKQ